MAFLNSGSDEAYIEDVNAKYHSKNFRIYLQGSYGNDTNIYAESDVDVVIELKSTFYSNKRDLPHSQRIEYDAHYQSATYHLEEFRRDVENVLVAYFGRDMIEDGKRSLKVYGFGNRRDVDVVVCSEYRKYHYYYGPNSCSFISGMTIRNAGEVIINYPKLHSEALTEKHKLTEMRYKPLIRILKNIKTKLVNLKMIDKKTAPSYFLEGWLYNAPNNKFERNIKSRFINVVNWLLKQDAAHFMMPHGVYGLIGKTNTQWNNGDYKKFTDSLVEYWNNWRE
jgi:hypothetical protein